MIRNHRFHRLHKLKNQLNLWFILILLFQATFFLNVRNNINSKCTFQMIFSYLSKHADSSDLKQHILEFQKTFTEIQKEALLRALLDLARVDNEFHAKEAELLNQISMALGYTLSGDQLITVLHMSEEYVLSTLR